MFEKEELTPTQQLNEYIMISLRTLEGCDLAMAEKRFGSEVALLMRSKAERYISEGTMRYYENRLVLSPEGRLLADGIAADLFF